MSTQTPGIAATVVTYRKDGKHLVRVIKSDYTLATVEFRSAIAALLFVDDNRSTGHYFAMHADVTMGEDA